MLRPTNGAVMKCFGGYLPLANVELVDEKQLIYRGERIVEPGTPADSLEYIYFSRRYDREHNPIDATLRELTIEDPSLIGFPFWLVPKEKVVFGYDKPSVIARPDIRLSKSSPLGDIL